MKDKKKAKHGVGYWILQAIFFFSALLLIITIVFAQETSEQSGVSDSVDYILLNGSNATNATNITTTIPTTTTTLARPPTDEEIKAFCFDNPQACPTLNKTEYIPIADTNLLAKIEEIQSELFRINQKLDNATTTTVPVKTESKPLNLLPLLLGGIVLVVGIFIFALLKRRRGNPIPQGYY